MILCHGTGNQSSGLVGWKNWEQLYQVILRRQNSAHLLKYSEPTLSSPLRFYNSELQAQTTIVALVSEQEGNIIILNCLASDNLYLYSDVVCLFLYLPRASVKSFPSAKWNKVFYRTLKGLSWNMEETIFYIARIVRTAVNIYNSSIYACQLLASIYYCGIILLAVSLQWFNLVFWVKS